MKFISSTIKLSYWLLVSLFVFSSHAIAENNNKKLPLFTEAEVHLIKTLSSQNYVNTTDISNRVSGNTAAIALGKKLFFNPELSGDGTVSCSTCHNPSMAWGDHNTITSLRPNHPSSRHIPSLWGVKYNRWYFWDGRADSLWSQAVQPIENSAEMAGNRVQVARFIMESPTIRRDYEALFGAIPSTLLQAKLPLTARPVPDNKQDPDHQRWLTLSKPTKQAINRLFTNIGKSIAAFEETLVLANSPFDQFAENITAQAGQSHSDALSVSAIRGLKLFIGHAGCVNCHFGPNFSDGEFHHLFLEPVSLKGDLGRFAGVKKLLADPFNGNSDFSDRGKKSRNKLDYVYQNIEFRGQFKTPSLRNIAQSYPYMHTGEFKTLTEVLKYYNTISKRMKPNGHQEVLLKSLDLSKSEINDLVEFLKSLTASEPDMGKG